MNLKGEETVEWINRLNDSIDYLEDNIHLKLDMDQAAKVALSSKFHFQRMFHMITGVTVAEYVRKRRLTLAAQELATSNAKVIDIALKYGYQTPEAFTKAFNKIHGINPSKARDVGIKLKAYPRFSFQIQIKGEKVMNYRIVEKESFKIIGRCESITTVDGKNYEIIPKLWEEANKNGLCQELLENSGELGLLGICMDYNAEEEKFTYVIASEKTCDDIPKDLREIEIPSGTWAVFESIGPMPGAIQEVWKRIFTEWFPATGYEHADAPEIEAYLPGNPQDSDYKCEVWIPIIKK